eukprot:g5108.t1
MSLSQLKSAFSEICRHYREDRDVDEEDLDSCIEVLNQNFSMVKMQIKKMTHETKKTDYYCLVNTEADNFSAVASNLDEWQLIFFKGCVKAIIEKRGSASEEEIMEQRSSALVLAAREQKGKPHASEVYELVQRLTAQNWLEEADNCYSLGARSVLELADLLEEFDCPECVICGYLVVNSFKCPNEKCNLSMHLHCERNLALTKQKSKMPHVCPVCQISLDIN